MAWGTLCDTAEMGYVGPPWEWQITRQARLIFIREKRTQQRLFSLAAKTSMFLLIPAVPACLLAMQQDTQASSKWPKALCQRTFRQEAFTMQPRPTFLLKLETGKLGKNSLHLLIHQWLAGRPHKCGAMLSVTTNL